MPYNSQMMLSYRYSTILPTRIHELHTVTGKFCARLERTFVRLEPPSALYHSSNGDQAWRTRKQCKSSKMLGYICHCSLGFWTQIPLFFFLLHSNFHTSFHGLRAVTGPCGPAASWPLFDDFPLFLYGNGTASCSPCISVPFLISGLCCLLS